MRLYNEDCIKVMKQIKDNSIDLVITDPPYTLTSGGRVNTKYKVSEKLEKNMKKGKLFEFNNIKTVDWLKEVYRVLKEQTHCYIFCNDKHLKEFLTEAEKVGFKEVNVLIWNKSQQPPTQFYMKCCEFILMFRKGKAKYINNIGTKTLLNIQGLKGKQKRHPTEKPVELLKILIENSSKKGEIILDCFCGSGSTCIAAKELNREYIGIEIDPEYYNISLNRLNKYKK